MEKQPSHVLLAGGSPSSWSGLTCPLQAEGYTFEVIPAGCEPSELTDRARECDAVVIIDLAADLMRAMELVSACRRVAASTPVVVVADNPSVELARSIRESGVFYLALHPLGVDELRTVVDDALRSVGRNRPTGSRCLTKKRILIVDDDADFREAISTLLRSEDYLVCCASSAREGREKLGVGPPPDLVILDVVMEDGWAGYAMNQAVKHGDLQKVAGEIPILMVSSIQQPPEASFSTAGEVGMLIPDTYMTKPLNLSSFLDNVRRLLAREHTRTS